MNTPSFLPFWRFPRLIIDLLHHLRHTLATLDTGRLAAPPSLSIFKPRANRSDYTPAAQPGKVVRDFVLAVEPNGLMQYELHRHELVYLGLVRR